MKKFLIFLFVFFLLGCDSSEKVAGNLKWKEYTFSIRELHVQFGFIKKEKSVYFYAYGGTAKGLIIIISAKKLKYIRIGTMVFLMGASILLYVLMGCFCFKINKKWVRFLHEIQQKRSRT